MKFLSACFVLLLFLQAIIAPALAYDQGKLPQVTLGQVNESIQKTAPLRFLPSQPLYFLITFKETVSRFFQPSAAQRAQFDLIISGKRLKEIYLLLKNDKLQVAQQNFLRYSTRTNAMIEQLEKARSQNQDTTNVASQIAEDFKYHEILIAAIRQTLDQKPHAHQIDEDFDKVVNSFTSTVLVLDGIKPGIKDRFRITTDLLVPQKLLPPSLPNEPSEASPATRPKRIIY